MLKINWPQRGHWFSNRLQFALGLFPSGLRLPALQRGRCRSVASAHLPLRWWRHYLLHNTTDLECSAIPMAINSLLPCPGCVASPYYRQKTVLQGHFCQSTNCHQASETSLGDGSGVQLYLAITGWEAWGLHVTPPLFHSSQDLWPPPPLQLPDTPFQPVVFAASPWAGQRQQQPMAPLSAALWPTTTNILMTTKDNCSHTVSQWSTQAFAGYYRSSILPLFARPRAQKYKSLPWICLRLPSLLALLTAWHCSTARTVHVQHTRCFASRPKEILPQKAQLLFRSFSFTVHGKDPVSFYLYYKNPSSRDR